MRHPERNLLPLLRAGMGPCKTKKATPNQIVEGLKPLEVRLCRNAPHGVRNLRKPRTGRQQPQGDLQVFQLSDGVQELARLLGPLLGVGRAEALRADGGPEELKGPIETPRSSRGPLRTLEPRGTQRNPGFLPRSSKGPLERPRRSQEGS